MRHFAVLAAAVALFAAGWLTGQNNPPDLNSRMAALARQKQAYADGLAPVAKLIGKWHGAGTSPWGPFEEDTTSEWVMDGGLLQVTSVRRAMGMVVGQSTTVFAYDPARKEIYAVILRPYGNAITYKVSPSADGKTLTYEFISGIGAEALPYPIQLEIRSDSEYAIRFDRAQPGEAPQPFECVLTREKKSAGAPEPPVGESEKPKKPAPDSSGKGASEK